LHGFPSQLKFDLRAVVTVKLRAHFVFEGQRSIFIVTRGIEDIRINHTHKTVVTTRP